ncbi:MAG: aminotransferase class I/II-fold pyridoxal phosphate-dependent enzyme [Desulfovibrio sp.]|nr:aminotransferase class I/II-fold pyridoxal phosphate-dependent enzyme [Desulfovibrio sp.]
MSANKLFGLTQADKTKLLQSIRGIEEPGGERSVEFTVSPELLRFETMPKYSQILVQKAVSEKLNSIQPYYICHDGLSQEYATIQGRRCLNFSCYDYLGLNGDERLRREANMAMEKYGISASASRLTAGERPPHRELEKALAALYGVEDCLVFVSGHGTNVSTLQCLFGSHDVIFSDQCCHNSLLLGASASGAARFTFPNNDIHSLRGLLRKHRAQFKRALIVTEGLFGMDGCLAPLPELVALKQEFGCFLMVDEAHSIGVVGKTGRGVSEHFKVATTDVDIWMGTLSKTFCGCGGFIAGSHVLIEILKYSAPGFVYSVGMPPLLAAVSRKALEIMLAEPWRVSMLQANSRFMLEQIMAKGLNTGMASGYAVIPVYIGDSLTCVTLADLLLQEGIFVVPIIYPGVAEGQARLRFFISQRHTKEQMQHACETTAALLPKAREIAASYVTK